MENETKQADWNDINGDYVKLETDKAKMLLLTDWALTWIEKFKDEKASKLAGKDILKVQLEFSAKVLSEDGKPANKTFSTTSNGALKGLREIFEGRPKTDLIMVRIKKIGEGVKTVYDIEEQSIPINAK